jgi:hypothetical protein
MRFALACFSSVVLYSLLANSKDALLVAPPCRNPARLIVHDGSAPGYFVSFGEITSDISAKFAALAKKYHLGYQQFATSFFVESISEDTIARLRCVPGVQFIESNAIGHVTDAAVRVPNERLERSRVASSVSQAGGE